MAERKVRRAPPQGGAFVARRQVMAPAALRRAITRIAHEIVERNHGVGNLVVIGLQTGGLQVAMTLAATLEEIEQAHVPLGELDVSFYRDDIGLRPVPAGAPTEIPDINGQVVVLVDDVLHTGRTVRAALNALMDHGRPAAVQLAVVIDRGRRELPIRPDYVGKNVPTAEGEIVEVSADGVWTGELRGA